MKTPSRSARLALRWSLALFAGSTLLAMSAHAQWKWRDKDGHVTVSDRPPPKDVPDTDILSRPVAQRQLLPTAPAGSAPSDTPVRPGPLQNELEQRKRAAEQERAAKLKADEDRVAAQRAENCRQARRQETALASGQRMARINANGEREIIDDQARADELRSVRAVIASDCR